MREGFGWQWVARRARPGRLYRLLGRVPAWRWLQRRVRRVTAIGLGLPVAPAATLFPDVSVDAALRGLRGNGFHGGLLLPAATVEALVRHARVALCRRLPADPERFRIAEISDGRTPHGRVVAVADVDLVSCAAAERIARDATLIAIVRGFLGYPPRAVAARLYWSPVATLSDAERRDNGQTIDFHYDIERQPTLYAFFYLGDTDRRGGAHVAIAGSHRGKPLALAFGPTHRPDVMLLARYGPDRMIALEGPSGFGFVEDPYCYHKALPPLSGPRLVLQLRYS